MLVGIDGLTAVVLVLTFVNGLVNLKGFGRVVATGFLRLG